MKRLLLIMLLLAAGRAAAREVYPLDEGWSFFFKYENSGDNARPVTLPHTWERSGPPALQATGNYTRTLYVPQAWAGKRLFVKCYGAEAVADLFVNGSHAGEHRGGGTAFTFEITDKVKYDANNLLLFVINNSHGNDVLPTSAEADRPGGIFRDVELIVTGPTAVSPLYYGSDGVLIRPKSVSADRVEAEAEVHLLAGGGAGSCPLTLEATAPDGTTAVRRTVKVKLDGKPVTIPFAFDAPQLWSPSSPALYRIDVRLGDAEVLDEVSVRTGFRTIEVSPEGGFRINGGRIPVRGVTLYHDDAASAGRLTPPEFDRDLGLIREMGANAIRSAEGPHAQYLYDRCDEQGMIVWIDSPLQRAPFLGDVAFFDTPRFRENGLQQLREIIVQHCNHPSVAMWGISSLLWTRGDSPVSYIRQLHEEAHRLDPSRPTVACSDQDGEINLQTDLIVWQQSVGWSRGSLDDATLWSELLHKQWGALRSGVAYGGEGAADQQQEEFGKAQPNCVQLPEGRQTQFHEAYARQLEPDSLFWGLWINNMFDYGASRRPLGINYGGMVTRDRRVRKDAFYLYKALWNRQEPTLHIVGKRLSARTQPEQRIRVYSSLEELPTLLIGGDTVAMTACAPCQYETEQPITIEGRAEIEVRAGSLSDRAVIRIDSSLKQKKN